MSVTLNDILAVVQKVPFSSPRLLKKHAEERFPDLSVELKEMPGAGWTEMKFTAPDLLFRIVIARKLTKG